MTNASYQLIEAESFNLEWGFSIVQSGVASGGAWVQHDTGPTAKMSTTVLDQAGTYDLVISYFDENDGSAEATVKIDGVTIAQWTWDQDLGSANANESTLTTYVVKGVTLAEAATLTIEGAADGREMFRFDKVELVPSDTASAPSNTSLSVDGDTATGQLLAFEGAQGFGATTQGGRGGQIVKVTNLDDSGVGSLRWALEDLTGPRIVVFEVGGEIQLKDQIEINGQVTVAGQTAPGGITISGARLRVVESDVIIRGLNIRPGDGDGDDPENRDGISVGKRGSVVDGVIIDSNSISWAVDEGASTWGAPSNVTFSNNIIAEGLQDSIHPKGSHSMGMLIGDGSSNITVVGNLIAHNQYRNVTVKDDSTGIEFINNVVYNYGPNGFLAHEASTAHVIGNLYIAGADSASREPIRLESPEDGAAYYLSDNVGEVTGAAVSKISNSYVFAPSNVTIMSSSEVLDYVLSHAGARVPDLGPIDARIIQSVIDGSGSIIDSPDDVGGYQLLPAGQALSDADGDGIPDDYESIIGSDPTTFDAHGDADGDGYSNIEDYINGLIDGFGSSTTTDTEPTTTDPEPTTTDPEPTTQAEPIRYEAESMTLSPNFRIESNGHASDKKLIRATDDGLHSASFTFDGASGIYDIVIDYFDENDGVSTLSVIVGGETVDTWEWDRMTSSHIVNKETATSYILENVAISQGDSIVLAGYQDGQEPLRIDAVELVPDLLIA